MSLSGNAVALRLESILGCFYVRTPTNVIDCPIRRSTSHYPAAVYDYISACLRAVIDGKEDTRAKINDLSIEIANNMDILRSDPYLRALNILGEIDSMGMDNPEEVLAVIDDWMKIARNETLVSRLKGFEARVWRDRADGNADLAKATELMRISADSGTKWAKNELLGLLWEIDTPESLLEMVSRAFADSQEGSSTAKGCIG